MVTGSDGSYQLKLPADAAGKTLDMQVSASGLRPARRSITVSPAGQSEDFSVGLSFHDEITVGSRAPGAEAEKAVPVEVLTVWQIETTGASETNAIIQALAPSFNFPRPTISDGADTVRPATLRGLGPDQVLVLINGKRRHQSAHVVTSGVIGRGTTGVDLNAIPASAIEKIEVLRDGAAAPIRIGCDRGRDQHRAEVEVAQALESHRLATSAAYLARSRSSSRYLDAHSRVGTDSACLQLDRSEVFPRQYLWMVLTVIRQDPIGQCGWCRDYR